MRLSDILLVTISDEYRPRNGIFTYEELKEYCTERMGCSDKDLLLLAEKVLMDRKEKQVQIGSYQLEIGYCMRESQLLGFLCRTEDGYKNKQNESLICSKDCEMFLYNRGFAKDGKLMLASVKYEVQDMNFKEGQVIENFNGNRYQVMEVYKKDNLLLKNEDTSEFMVAYGICYYVRFPVMEEGNPVHTEYGVEWQHGRYLDGLLPSQIDFVQLKQEYGTDYGKKGEEFQIEIREILSRVENVKASNLGDAIDQAMEMYNDERIVLNAEDYKGVTFIPKEER